jgi:hypothetical protein
MEFLTNFWRNAESLRTVSTYLQWFAILLVFLGGSLQLAKFVVDRRETKLVSIAQSQRERQQVERESQLVGKVTTLENDLSKRQSEIEDLKKKTEFVDPFKQPIRTGTATVDVVVRSSDTLNNHFMDQGGYIAFGKGNDALLLMSSIDCFAKQTGNNQVLYRGIFNLDAADKSIGKPISYLTSADYAQIGFKPMPEKSEILRGTAICTFNSTVRIELVVPPQRIPKDFIKVPDVKNAFSEYTKGLSRVEG